MQNPWTVATRAGDPSVGGGGLQVGERLYLKGAGWWAGMTSEVDFKHVQNIKKKKSNQTEKEIKMIQMAFFFPVCGEMLYTLPHTRIRGPFI